MFDLSDYNVRQLDPQQGTKPLDFGRAGLAGSVNLDGRLIAINTYHPEHGYITLTSIPPFPDEDRYDQKKVRAYRKSLVANEGFGLQFEQDIIKREYYLIGDVIPFMRFTLVDGAIAECVTWKLGSSGAFQTWKFSQDNIQMAYQGDVWLKRAEYTQLTEGGVVPMPPIHTEVLFEADESIEINNNALNISIAIDGVPSATPNQNNGLTFNEPMKCEATKSFVFQVGGKLDYFKLSDDFIYESLKFRQDSARNNHLIINRAITYGNLCITQFGCLLTDHMILPLLWTRDSFYTMDYLLQDSHENENHLKVISYSYIQWLFEDTWRGTYCKSKQIPIASAWARSYMANGMPKDNRAFQLDQQIFPFLALVNYLKRWDRNLNRERYVPDVKKFLHMLNTSLSDIHYQGLFPTDETPADDDIPLHYHFSSHILLWYTLHGLQEEFVDYIEPDKIPKLISKIEEAIPKYFITEHKGKQIYSYATDGEGNHYLYHDANDIPLVMMPLWGFCDKDDPIWRNTIDFAFSSDNPGFYDGVLGSVHTPAPWSLGDAQELILSKVIGDRERYQQVWERVEKAAQWDGALPEAYDANTFEVVSRHWFAWTNAMVAIADSLSWDWETEGEYAR